MDGLIIVKARVKIFTEAEGGRRRTGIASGYRPNHVFEPYEGRMMIAHPGDVILPDINLVYPAMKKKLL